MKRAYFGAALCIVWAALTAWAHLRRQCPAPEDEVQPPDPRTMGLAFPEHDPGVIHVAGSSSLDCHRCVAELIAQASWQSPGYLRN